MNVNLNFAFEFACEFFMNLNFVFSKSTNLNLIFSTLMNLNFVSKPMNLNLNIKN